MKKIALLAVKNEAWILEKNLAILDSFCDVILISDGQSTDGSLEIYARFNKVQLVKEHSVSIKGQNRRYELLNAARKFEGNNLLFFLDADELVMLPLDEEAWEKTLEDLKPGEIIEVPWLWLWKSPIHYRDDDSVWSDRWLPLVFFDDRIAQYEVGDWHESRVPGAGHKIIRNSEMALVHYATVAQSRFESRQNWCMIMEFLRTKNPVKQINITYAQTLDERKIKLKILPEKCLNQWTSLGVNVKHLEDPELNWYDHEILTIMANESPQKFLAINIWDTNWEYKRQLAIAAGLSNIPSTCIEDKRNWEQRLYHYYLKKYIQNPFWRDIFYFKYKVSALVKRYFPGVHAYLKNKLSAT